LPELPDAKRERFMRDYGLSEYDAGVLTAERALADYFEAVVGAGAAAGGAADDAAAKARAKTAANWVMGELTGALNRHGLGVEQARVPAPVLAELLALIAKGTISNKIAKEVFEALWDADARGPDGVQKVGAIIAERGLVQISDSASIEALVDEVIAANGAQVELFRAGKQQVLGFLVGQVMKASRGKANPQQVNEALRRKLGG
jgi:aspartyl-tRNA(Asn)/glutamyl-tRNA(Gln) amidotransferase subunit B